MICQTILGRYIQVSSIELNIEYRMIRFLIPKAGFILRMQIYAVYRNTQTILLTWGAFPRSPMPIYAVGIAQMPSINTPTIRVHTRRDLRRSINAITRAYVRRFVCAVRSAYYGVRSINPAIYHIVSDIEDMLRAA